MSVPSAPVFEPLDEDVYWEIVQKSVDNTSSDGEQLDYLVGELTRLSPLDIIGFSFRTSRLLAESYLQQLWCAAYIMNGGCSDDGFDYFRAWLISRGKGIYRRAVVDPDSLIEIAEGEDEYELELFLGAPYTAFEKVTGSKAYSYMDGTKFREKYGAFLGIQFEWSEDDADSMKRICPRLYERFWS